MKNIILVIALISCFGCARDTNFIDVETIVLSPIKKISEINDTTFLSLVLNITEEKGFIYFSDSKNNRIVCVDSNYKLVHHFGSPGKGPSNFIYPGGVMVNNSKLYAIDEDNNKINIYDLLGKHISNISGIVPSLGRFIVNDSVYFGSSDDIKAPIFEAHLNGELVKRFGNNNRVLNNVNENMPRKFFLETWKNQIIAICDSDPVIERYSFNGELIDSFNYSNLKYFNSFIPYVKGKQEKEIKSGLKGITSFCLRSYMKEGRLYLLLGGFDKSKNKEKANHILVLDVVKEKITPVKMLELRNDNGSDSWYYAFCVVDDKLIAYDCYAYEIQEFSIKF